MISVKVGDADMQGDYPSFRSMQTKCVSLGCQMPAQPLCCCRCNTGKELYV